MRTTLKLAVVAGTLAAVLGTHVSAQEQAPQPPGSGMMQERGMMPMMDMMEQMNEMMEACNTMMQAHLRQPPGMPPAGPQDQQ